MNVVEWLKILKTDKLIALVMVLGSIILLFLSEIKKIIELPTMWKNIFFCIVVFCGLFLLLSLAVSIGSFIKGKYINRNRPISHDEYMCLEFFSKLPNQGTAIENITGIDETEKRYLLSVLVEKGLLSLWIDYYSLTDKGRLKILEKRKSKAK